MLQKTLRFLRMLGILTAGIITSRAFADVSNLSQLTEILEGKRPLAGFSVVYREQRPLERFLEVEVKGDGAVSTTVRRLAPNCLRPWDASCWQIGEYATRVTDESVRGLIAALIDTGLAVPHYPAIPAPGTQTFDLTVTVSAGTSLRFVAPLSGLSDDSPWGRVRVLLLALVEEAPLVAPGGDIPR